MTQKQERRLRLTIDLTEEQERGLIKFFLWGERQAFFSMLIDDVINKLDKHGRVIFGAYKSRQIGIEDISPMFKMEEEDKR